jgi:hypothetical protein
MREEQPDGTPMPAMSSSPDIRDQLIALGVQSVTHSGVRGAGDEEAQSGKQHHDVDHQYHSKRTTASKMTRRILQL